MATAADEGKIDIGRVIGQGFEALRANFLPFLAASLLLVGLPTFAWQYWLFSPASGADASLMLSGSYWMLGLAGFAVTFVTGALLQGMVVRSTILHLSGREADLGHSIGVALRLILPIIGVSILVGIVVMLGLIALIVPGVIAYLMFIVAVPALLEEGRGVTGSMQRSRDLTRGTRGRIFLLVIILFVISFIIGVVVSSIVGLFGMTSSFGQPFEPLTLGLAEGIGGSLTGMITAVLVSALYMELRSVKEGATNDELASIFA